MTQRIVAFTIGIILGIILFRSVTSAEEIPSEMLSGGPSVRLKDICRVSDVRPNQLVGYGLIVGLNGTGDGKNTFFTAQSIVNMLQRFGVNVDKDKMKVNAIAAVMITAELPAFSRIGDKLDVTVSALGDASDLSGGVLLQTPLVGADKTIYAVAQGPVSLGGGDASGKTKKKAHPTVGRVPDGGIVEKEITCPVSIDGRLSLVLKNSDFTTASRVVEAIDAKFGAGNAIAVDASKIDVAVPSDYTDNIVGFISLLENLSVTPDIVARVVINERTGTVVMGENLCILPVAVSHKDLYLVITGEEARQEVKAVPPTIIVSAPEIGTGTMAKALEAIKLTPTTEQIATVLEIIKQQQAAPSQAEQPATAGTETVAASQSPAGTTPVAQAGAQPAAAAQSQGRVVSLSTRVKVGDVVKGLSSVGATPQDVIAVLQAIKAAGALQAEIVIM